MSNLYCRKDGQRWWEDKTIHYDGGFSLITKGPLNVNWCRCDSCNTALKMGKEAFLQEFMMHPELVQCSQAADYFDLSKVDCRICGSPKPALFTVVLFSPADSFEGHFEYVEKIYRFVQDAWHRDEEEANVLMGDGSVEDVLSYAIDEDDPYREFWKILGEHNGKLSPKEIE